MPHVGIDCYLQWDGSFFSTYPGWGNTASYGTERFAQLIMGPSYDQAALIYRPLASL